LKNGNYGRRRKGPTSEVLWTVGQYHNTSRLAVPSLPLQSSSHLQSKEKEKKCSLLPPQNKKIKKQASASTSSAQASSLPKRQLAKNTAAAHSPKAGFGAYLLPFPHRLAKNFLLIPRPAKNRRYWRWVFFLFSFFLSPFLLRRSWGFQVPAEILSS
jgi:hypothetical protein